MCLFKKLESQKNQRQYRTERDNSLVIDFDIPGKERKIPRNDSLLLKAVNGKSKNMITECLPCQFAKN